MDTLYKYLSEPQMVSNTVFGNSKQGGKGSQGEVHRSLHFFQGEMFTSSPLR